MERPALRRPFAFGGALPWVAAALLAPLFAAFVWQHGLCSVGDDSVSYLVLARWISGRADAWLAPWVPWHTHFPPVFPAVLALLGADAADLLPAHLAVAGFAALATGLLARHAALRLGSVAAGLLVALGFVATPTAWVSLKGVLSESLFLLVTLAALHYHATRIERALAPGRAFLVLGLLLAVAYLTRAIGITLVAAYVLRSVLEAAAGRDRRLHPWLALLPVGVLAASWMLLRPGGRVYGATGSEMVRAWLTEPGVASHAAYDAFAGGWLASFMAESGAPPLQAALLALLGALAIAGALRAARRNRLDGWYVLLCAALVFAWPFGENNTRRLLYPLVPLALLHAAEIAMILTRSLPTTLRGPVAATLVAAPLTACLPALALVAQKSADREPFVAGGRYAARDIVQYYTTVNAARARAFAAKHAAILSGLERLAADTPQGSRVMWLRPEYVALLGRREGVPAYFEWDARRTAAEIRDAGVDYVVFASLSKTDLHQRSGEPAANFAEVETFCRRRTVIANAVTGQPEYVLLEVDRAALARYLAPE